MKNFVMLLLIGCIVSGCKNRATEEQHSSADQILDMRSLLNTKWQFQVADGCTNYYIFKKDSSSVYYSCESDEKYYGKYFVKDDTLYIHNFVTDTDSLLSPIESEHKSQESKYKLVFKGNRLKHLERWSYSISNDSWTKDDFKFDEDFLFEKVEQGML